MDWLEHSEICFGLVWEGRRLPTAFNADDLAPPYDEALRILQKPKGSREDVAKKIAPKFLQDAHSAVYKMNGLGDDAVWDTGISQVAEAYRLGVTLEKAGKKMQRNENVDILPLYGKITGLVSKDAIGLTRADQIDFKNYKSFMKCGYKPIDDIIGGIPSDGPIVAYGVTGVGKSYWLANLITCFLQTYKKKTAAIYTLEMSAEHWLARTLKMYPDMKDVLPRLYVSGAVRNIEELVAETTMRKVDIVGLDDMDGIVEDESPSAYQKVYKRIREICRFLKIPVVALGQPNRATKQSIEMGEKFLSPYDIAWSGAGENAAALLVALQKANNLDMSSDQFPTEDTDREFMIFWKSRDGWPAQQGPGAIRLEPNPKGTTPLWRGTPFQNKLWRPNSSKKVIGKNGSGSGSGNGKHKSRY